MEGLRLLESARADDESSCINLFAAVELEDEDFEDGDFEEDDFEEDFLDDIGMCVVLRWTTRCKETPKGGISNLREIALVMLK
jgi:hypothetical protein